MTPLRERMLEELCRHNYAPRTRETYVSQIAKLARHFGTSPDQLSREQVQEYQDLLTSQRASWLPQAVAAMQFLYGKVLERNWKIAHSYRPKPQEAAVVLAMGGGYQAYFKQDRDGAVRDLADMDVMAEVAQFCRQRQAYCHRSVAVPQIALRLTRIRTSLWPTSGLPMS